MFKKTEETKVLRDVIHGYIHVEYQVIWDLINAKEFQRLRRISQLGGVHQVYHNAEHSRFTHSLGVYEIVRRMVYEIKDIHDRLSEEEKVIVMIAGLLHDVGHLPFSHAFQNICPVEHEQFSRDIILMDSDIHCILQNISTHLAKQVADIIDYKHENEILNQIVSGQLDADRMDYLLRDAYFSGTSYGKFDIERILRTIRVRENKIVVKESGMHSVEDYIMARYHMYWQVYYHPVARSFEHILFMIFKRMKEIYPDESYFYNLDMFTPFLEEKQSVRDHFMLDEHASYYGFGVLTRKNDQILKELALCILDRRLFKYDAYSEANETQIREQLIREGKDPEYYMIVDTMSKSPYSPYDGHNIYILTQQGEVKELSTISIIVSSLLGGKIKEDKKIYYYK